METLLTKRIKEALRSYKPILSGLRTIRWAEEVNTGKGYVDSIRFENFIENEDEVYTCEKFNFPISKAKIKCSKEKCSGCVLKNGNLDKARYGILTTCFEIKITKSDFKSKNGHNFEGNKNYYVVPKELYENIKDEVPEDIGIILFYNNGHLRIKKECLLKDITSKKLNELLFNALKKWCDFNN